MAETLGPTNTAQVIDLLPNNGNEFTPAYAIYENGKMARMALFNYMTDPSSANDYTATISLGGAAMGEQNETPAQVQVKYVLPVSMGWLKILKVYDSQISLCGVCCSERQHHVGWSGNILPSIN
jgi:hypothetical protein